MGDIWQPGNYYDPAALAAQFAEMAINYDSVLKTNESNRQNVESTNEANKYIAQINNAANRDLWLAQAEYNSPKNQVQRMREAGFSPVAALGTSGLNSSMSPNPNQQVGNPMVAPHAEVPQIGGLADTMLSSTQTDAYAKKMLADARMTDLKADKESDRLSAEIEWMRQNKRLTESEADTRLLDLAKKEQTYNDDVNAIHSASVAASENARKAKFDADRQQFEYNLRQKYGDSEVQKQLAILDAQKREIDQRRQYYIQQGHNLEYINRQISAYIESINADIDLKKQLYDYNEQAYPERLKTERMTGQQSQLQYFFDTAHYLDLCYNALERDNYSVQSARDQLKLLHEQITMARQQNDWYAVQQLEGVANTLYGGIQTAKNGRLLDSKVRDIESSIMRANRKRTDRIMYFDKNNKFNGQQIKEYYPE